MTRRYDIQGTKTYLIWALFLLVIGLWHAWDGWAPRPEVLNNHPKTVQVSALADGIVDSILVKEGETVGKDIPLVRVMSESDGLSRSIDMSSAMADTSKVTQGLVTAVPVTAGQSVLAGEPLMVLTSVKDSFYLYNKSVAVLFLIAAMVCLYIHVVVR